jgi:hypothetical protein
VAQNGIVGKENQTIIQNEKSSHPQIKTQLFLSNTVHQPVPVNVGKSFW